MNSVLTPVQKSAAVVDALKTVLERAKQPLVVLVEREYWIPWFKITLPNGQSEELDPDETVAWFKVRGADMPIVEKALDHCWNFRRCVIEIENPKEPPVLEPHVQPRL